MVTLNELSIWLKENTSLSDSSVYKYSHAVNTISNLMLNKEIIPTSLFHMSLLQYDQYLPIILHDSDFTKKNSIGNNMYSSALKQYRMFIYASSELIIEKEEVIKSIHNYTSLKETEKSAIIKSRVGQGIFRQNLIEKYNGTCIVTGISVKKILIASHIKPWSVSNNAERLSSENGLLLSPTFDKLFDYGFITFSNDGKIITSSHLPKIEQLKLGIKNTSSYDLKITSEMKENLEYHRDVIFVK